MILKVYSVCGYTCTVTSEGRRNRYRWGTALGVEGNTDSLHKLTYRTEMQGQEWTRHEACQLVELTFDRDDNSGVIPLSLMFL